MLACFRHGIIQNRIFRIRGRVFSTLLHLICLISAVYCLPNRKIFDENFTEFPTTKNVAAKDYYQLTVEQRVLHDSAIYR